MHDRPTFNHHLVIDLERGQLTERMDGPVFGGIALPFEQVNVLEPVVEVQFLERPAHALGTGAWLVVERQFHGVSLLAACTARCHL